MNIFSNHLSRVNGSIWIWMEKNDDVVVVVVVVWACEEQLFLIDEIPDYQREIKIEYLIRSSFVSLALLGREISRTTDRCR